MCRTLSEQEPVLFWTSTVTVLYLKLLDDKYAYTRKYVSPFSKLV